MLMPGRLVCQNIRSVRQLFAMHLSRHCNIDRGAIFQVVRRLRTQFFDARSGAWSRCATLGCQCLSTISQTASNYAAFLLPSKSGRVRRRAGHCWTAARKRDAFRRSVLIAWPFSLAMRPQSATPFPWLSAMVPAHNVTGAIPTVAHDFFRLFRGACRSPSWCRRRAPTSTRPRSRHSPSSMAQRSPIRASSSSGPRSRYRRRTSQIAAC
jgi:hypothetical protein